VDSSKKMKSFRKVEQKIRLGQSAAAYEKDRGKKRLKTAGSKKRETSENTIWIGRGGGTGEKRTRNKRGQARWGFLWRD